MRNLIYIFFLLFSSACSNEQDTVAKQGNPTEPDVNAYKRALAYGTQIDLNKLDVGVDKNLLVRLYQIPLSENNCFNETHGICQYQYLLSVSSFDEQPQTNVFKLPVVGEITGISWHKQRDIDEAKIEFFVNQFSQAALKNNPALKNSKRQYALTVNLKNVVVKELRDGTQHVEKTTIH